MTRQSIQRDQILIFKTKRSTFAKEQNHILISPIQILKIFKIGKFSWILSLDPHWGVHPPGQDHFLLCLDEKVAPAILKTLICIGVSVKYWGVKIHTNLAGNTMLMISPLNWMEPIPFSSKEENALVRLKYQDPFIEYASFESCLSYGLLAWDKNFSTIQCIVNFNTRPCSSNDSLRITSLWLLIKYWSGPVKYWFNYISIIYW